MTKQASMRLIRTTLPDETDAKELAKQLVEADLAVCVHASKIISTYRWQSKVVEEIEWLVEMRCFPEHVEACQTMVLERHPYEIPLVEQFGETKVNQAYAEWAVNGVTKRT